MKMLFMRFREILVARVSKRICDHARSHSLNDQTGEALAGAHGYFADGLRVQALGRPKRQTILLSVQNIDRTNFGLHSFRHGGDDAIESLLKVVGLTDKGTDIGEDIEMRRNIRTVFFSFSHSCRGRLISIKHKLRFPASEVARQVSGARLGISCVALRRKSEPE